MPTTPEQYNTIRENLKEDAIDTYHIGIDEQEVISAVYHGSEGFPTFQEAEAHRRSYDWLNSFYIYHVVIKPVTAPEDTEASQR